MVIKQILGVTLILISIMVLFWVIRKIYSYKKTKYYNKTKEFLVLILEGLLDDGIGLLIVIWLITFVGGNLLFFNIPVAP